MRTSVLAGGRAGVARVLATAAGAWALLGPSPGAAIQLDANVTRVDQRDSSQDPFTVSYQDCTTDNKFVFTVSDLAVGNTLSVWATEAADCTSLQTATTGCARSWSMPSRSGTRGSRCGSIPRPSPTRSPRGRMRGQRCHGRASSGQALLLGQRDHRSGGRVLHLRAQGGSARPGAAYRRHGGRGRRRCVDGELHCAHHQHGRCRLQLLLRGCWRCWHWRSWRYGRHWAGQPRVVAELAARPARAEPLAARAELRARAEQRAESAAQEALLARRCRGRSRRHGRCCGRSRRHGRSQRHGRCRGRSRRHGRR